MRKEQREMRAKDILNALDAEVLVGEEHLDDEVKGACSSDMMSDVLAFSKDHSALLTGLCNPQVIRTVEMMDIICVIFVRGKVPNDMVLDMARERNLIVMSTKQPMFVASGILYQEGLRGGGPCGGNYDE